MSSFACGPWCLRIASGPVASEHARSPASTGMRIPSFPLRFINAPHQQGFLVLQPQMLSQEHPPCSGILLDAEDRPAAVAVAAENVWFAIASRR